MDTQNCVYKALAKMEKNLHSHHKGNYLNQYIHLVEYYATITKNALPKTSQILRTIAIYDTW